MRPPSQWLAPEAGTAMLPTLGRQGAAPGDQRAPPTPPHPPSQAQERTEADRRNGGPDPPRRGRCTRGEGAPRPRQAPARPARCRPTADRRRPGRRKRSGPFRSRPGEDGGANQGGGIPPPLPPPPPAALTRWLLTGPRPTPVGARQPPRHEYTPGGHAGEIGWQADARRGGGAGGQPPHPPPPPPPRAPSPSLGATGATHRPPGAEGAPPLPQKGPRRREGGCGWTCTPRAPAPPADCSRGGRGRQASPHQPARATRGPSLGAAHGGAPEQYGGRAPHDPPMTTAHSGRAEGGFRFAGAPGGVIHGPPLIPPHPGAAPRPRPHAHAEGECADDTRAARMGNHGPPRRGGAGRPQRNPPPPPPPPARRPRGPQPPPPEAGRMVPPPPTPERSRSAARPPRPSRRLPKEPRRTGEPAPTRQDAAQNAPSEGGRARTGVVWGATPPMDRTTPMTPALLPAQGRQRDRTRQSDPPPYRRPPAAQTGGTAHAPPPPLARPPAHKRHGPAPRHAAPTGPAGQGDRVGPPHPHAPAHSTWMADPSSPPSGRTVGGGGAPDPRRPSQQWKAPPPGTPFCHPHNPKQSRGKPGPDHPPPTTPDGARDRGRTRGGTRTTWNGPTSAQCQDRARCARHTTQGGGGERTPRERERTHTQRAHGDYQKGNRTELAERTDRVEWRTSERG